jgi:AcrR family transcriptional regulator
MDPLLLASKLERLADYSVRRVSINLEEAELPRVGLTASVVTDAAIALIDEQGPLALTLAAVAERTGVATPSLYKHVRNLAELRDRVTLRVMDELTNRLGSAVMGRSGDDAVSAAMWAYRQYVVEYPNRYAALPQATPDDPELDAAGERLVTVVLAILRGYRLTGTEAIHAVRCLRAAAHGFASLEAAGGFGLPKDLNTTYEQLVGMLRLGLTEAQRQHAG